MAKIKQIGGSFRDPSGFVYVVDGIVYRQVNAIYRANYEHLMRSGLYAELTDRQLLVPHSDASPPLNVDEQVYKVLRPEQLPFISYPYEWSFSQLKDAALATLEIQRRSLAHGMVLKDASAYNIQFCNGKPLLMDTLSFEMCQEGQAWVAYRQFCQHFLAPLALMSNRDVRLGQLLRVYIDGIPLDLAASLLPKHTYLNLGVAMHLHLHARAQKRYASRSLPNDSNRQKRLGAQSLMHIADNLRSTIRGLSWDHGHTSWAGYYEGNSYRDEGFESKQELVTDYINIVKPKCVWDLGANAGVFSRVSSQQGIFTVSIDSDPGVVEANYLRTKNDKENNLLPLLVDLNNPSAAIGWANDERKSLAERSNADCLLALALVHHIAISNNVPLKEVAQYFASLAEWLIIEFVPKSDKQVQKLLSSRKDIFEEYSLEGFEQSFGVVYDMVRSSHIQQSERVLYLFRRKES